MFVPQLLSALAAATPAGSEPLPWWLRFGGILAVAALAAALMVLVQTRHQRRAGVLWVLVIFLVPIIGPLTYIIAQSISYRRNNPTASKGRAERMAPEEYSTGQVKTTDDDAGPARRR